jgi:hypothetical protein
LTEIALYQSLTLHDPLLPEPLLHVALQSLGFFAKFGQ